jgi:hypothetical protein
MCPSTTLTSYKPVFIKDPAADTYIRSGLGYDRMTREIRFPVLDSNAPVADSTQSFQTFLYTDVSQYLSAVYAEQTTFSGGVFVLEDSFVKQFADVFDGYTINLAITQKLYNSFSTKVPSYTVIPEFLEILKTIPAYYDAEDEVAVTSYQEVIDIFGTDITVSSTHGGIFFQQTAIKECYSGNVGPDMISEIDSTINKQPPASLAYLDYRKLGVFDVKGGNPEIPAGDFPQIIASFPQDPAITGFSSIPLWEVAPAPYQAPLKAAIAAYVAGLQASVNSMQAAVEAARVASYKAPQSVYVYGQQTEQFGDTILYWDNCPYISVDGGFYTPRCTINIETASINSGAQSQFVNENWENEGMLSFDAQRDVTSGDVRLYGDFAPFYLEKRTSNPKTSFSVGSNVITDVMKLLNKTLGYGDSVVTSAWQHSGCVSLDYVYLTADPNFKLYFTTCIDCLPVIKTSAAQFGMKDSDLECVCQGF